MIIERVEIENIRSYKKETIDFKEGINFLSGDIGSGKSSILQAVEFALFGFKRGDLEGYQLLRKGETKGSIKVVLKDVEKNEKIEIGRFLKKSKTNDNVNQENGYILVNDNLIELSPQEINGYIFKFFNFPMEFITKDKNLVYRFTIYTPQEQLKEILFTTPDKRLEIIRKIFNIDKYKLLNDAISIYTGKIREEKKVYLAKLEPLNKYKEEIKKYEEDIKKYSKALKEIQEKEKEFLEKFDKHKNAIEKRGNALDKINQEILNNEKELSKFSEIEKSVIELEKRCEKKKEYVKRNPKEKIEKEIEKLKEEIIKKEKSAKDVSKNRDDLRKKLQENEKIASEREKINEKILDVKNMVRNYESMKKDFDYMLTKCQLKDLEGEISKTKTKLNKLPAIEKKIFENKEEIYAKKSELENIAKKIEERKIKKKSLSDIKVCDNCLQEVDKQHKKSIGERLEKEISDLKIVEKGLKEDFAKIENELKNTEKTYCELILIKELFIKKEERYENLKKKEKEERKKFEEMKKTRDKIKENNLEILEKEKEKIDEKIKYFEKCRKDIENLSETEVKLNKEISNMKVEVSDLKNFIKDYDNNLKEVELAEKEIQLKKDELKKRKKYLENKEKFKIEEEKIKKERNKLNENLEKINSNLRIITSKIGSYETYIKSFSDGVDEKNKEISKLEKLSQEYEKLLENEHFLSSDASDIFNLIERRIFSKYYAEFSLEFEALFKELIEDGDIDVRLDSEFSPIIEQNGYEIDVKNLSGGEKSSLAIAYRLGLKKIIESNLNENQKLSLLILDEPTDGFSENQISRLGELLKQSNLKQIILVSHDDKIESISDFVLHIEKTNHESRII